MLFQIKADLATMKLECVKHTSDSRPSFGKGHIQVIEYWRRVFTNSAVSARELSVQLDLGEIDMLQEMAVEILNKISITWDKLDLIPIFTWAEAKQVQRIDRLERKLARYVPKKKLKTGNADPIELEKEE